MLRLTSLRSRLSALLALSSLAALAASSAGCQLLAGLGGEETLGKGGTGGGGTTTTNGGTGGGGTGTGLTGPCSSGETQACYAGPDGTQGVGECKGGTATCGSDDMWSACEGEVLPQIESCSAPQDEDCNTLDCVVWLKLFGNDVNGSAVGVDSQGNVIAGVSFSSGIDFGDGDPVVPVGTSDMALLSYDKTGKLVWKTIFPATGYQNIQAISIDKQGNIAITGTTDGQIDFGAGKLPAGAFVAKLDSAGKVLWGVTGTGNAYPYYVAIDAKGNVFAGGGGQSVNFGTGDLTGTDFSNFWVAKFDSAGGSTDWVKITKGGGIESLSGIAVDPSDSVVLTGSWDSQYLGLSGDDTVPNDMYNGSGTSAPFLLRLDPDGNLSNSKKLAGFNGPVNVSVSAIANDKLGVSTLVGTFSGAVTFQSGDYDAGSDSALFILHDQTSGFNQTSKVFIQSGASSYPNAVGLDSKENIVLTGNYNGPFDFGGGPLPDNSSRYVAKLDKDGNSLWARTYSFGDGGIAAMAVGTLEDETVVIGNYYGDVDLGTGPLTGSGMFLMKLGR